MRKLKKVYSWILQIFTTDASTQKHVSDLGYLAQQIMKEHSRMIRNVQANGKQAIQMMCMDLKVQILAVVIGYQELIDIFPDIF